MRAQVLCCFLGHNTWPRLSSYMGHVARTGLFDGALDELQYLPDSQESVGNRFTELAVRLLTAQIRAIWECKMAGLVPPARYDRGGLYPGTPSLCCDVSPSRR